MISAKGMNVMDITADTSAPASGPFARFDRGLGYVVEAAAAAIVVAELVLLGAATTARYVFNSPFTWSDELATVLFIWLAVLGAVVAVRRGEHMRLTAFVRNLSPAWRARVDALALMLVCTVLVALFMPTWEHVESHLPSQMPVLEISEAFREAAILVGIVLMLMTAIDKLVQHATPWQIFGSLALVAVVSAGLYAIISAMFEKRKSDVMKVPMVEPVMVRWMVLTEPMRSARSPLENSRKKRAGAETTRSTSAACIATPMRDSNRITASERSTSSVMMETPATASAAMIAWMLPVDCAGIARSMSQPMTRPEMKNATTVAIPHAMSATISARRSASRCSMIVIRCSSTSTP